MKYPIDVTVPPAIMRGVGKTWIVAGCMIPVPEGTTLEDVGKWVRYVPPKPSKSTWKIASSSGGNYTVHMWSAERWTCDCPGHKFHKRCKHVTKARQLHDEASV